MRAILVLAFIGHTMASQAEVKRMVEQLLMMGGDAADRNLRMSPIAPDRPLRGPVSSGELVPETGRERMLQDPWMQYWLEKERERTRNAPFQNPNFNRPEMPPADAVPYEDPWSGPALAPDSQKSRNLLRRR